MDDAPDTLRNVPLVTALDRVEEVRRLAQEQAATLQDELADIDDNEHGPVFDALGFLRRIARDAQRIEEQLRRSG